MRIKNAGYFVASFILGLFITIILSTLSNLDSHERDILIIRFFEVKTFFTIGLLWYAPLLFFLNNSVLFKGVYRVLAYISPVLICIIYYRTLTSGYTEPDDRLYVGYLHLYDYYLDVGMGVLLSMIIIGTATEIKVRRKNKLQSPDFKLEDLQDNSIDINAPDERGYFPISLIIGSDNPKLLKEAIGRGINVNQDLGKGWTPLHEAFDYAIDGMIQTDEEAPWPEMMEMIRILIDNGADLKKIDIKGATPLDSFNTYASNLESFNRLKDMFRQIVPDIDNKIEFTKVTPNEIKPLKG